MEDVLDDLAHSKTGITHAIRKKLHFLDERLWKRFSARRLELIDTLDLGLRKASEQEEQIRSVSAALRVEFGYSEAYEDDFSRLVRAAVQSARRNRKRSLKAKLKGECDSGEKRAKVGGGGILAEKPGSNSTTFLTEIANVNADHNNELYDLNYSRIKRISSDDRARSAIESLTQPRPMKPLQRLSIKPLLLRTNSSPSPTVLPPMPDIDKLTSMYNACRVLLNYIERLKLCTECVTAPHENLQQLGQGIVLVCISYMFEKSLTHISLVSMEYLRNKLRSAQFQAGLFRNLNPLTKGCVGDDTAALISLHTVLGACVKDFGFEVIMGPLSEALYYSVVIDYPLIAKQTKTYEQDHALVSLAAVASILPQANRNAAGMRRPLPEVSRVKKQVILNFLTSVIEFSYYESVSPPPRYQELIDNARSAFKLSLSYLGIRNRLTNGILKNDSDVENVFKTYDKIELEILTHRVSKYLDHNISNEDSPKSRAGSANSELPILPAASLAGNYTNLMPPPLRQPSRSSETPTSPPHFEPLL